MEPDHAATLGQIAEKHPEAKIVCNAKTVGIIKQFFDLDIDSRSVVVKKEILSAPVSITLHL